MKTTLWRAAFVTALICIFAIPAKLSAQQSAPPAQTTAMAMPLDDSPHGGAAAETAPATPASVVKRAATTEDREAILKELAAMKARIAELESALKASDDTATAERSAAALRAAESSRETGSGQAKSAAPAAIPAADVESKIPAQTTTKGDAFPDDMTWVNNAGHNSDHPMATKYFTPEIRFDANYTIDYNHPKDDTLGGSTETFRSNEWQLDTVGIGGDIHVDNVRGRIMFMDGMYAVTTPRNDPSVVRGNWDLAGAYKYIAEGWGGYHWNVQHGINLDAGIFASYVGLFSYYNYDNWTYQPSYVSSNTPWFFNGMRLQWFPTSHLKIEPWFINGWQSYARPNGKPGLGGQILWMPKTWLYFVFNNYGLGEDDPGYPGRSRFHADYSTEIKYYDRPHHFLDKAAFALTGDMGCEYGGGGPVGTFYANGYSPEQGTGSTYTGGVNCHNDHNGRPKQSFLGWMGYTRLWFAKDKYAITYGGGGMNNNGRYLTLLPPINGATAVTGTPYFTQNPGDRSKMWDTTLTLDYMPSQFITFRLEEGYRHSEDPYWTGHGGVTPPGGNNGQPAQYACADGVPSGYGYGVAGQASAIAYCMASGNSNGVTGTIGNPLPLQALWWPDLRRQQIVSTLAILVRF